MSEFTSNGISIVEARPISSFKYLILGVPEVGLVGNIVVTHLINEMKLKEIAAIESEFLPPVIVIHNAEPKSPIRLYGNEEILVLTSEIPIPVKIVYKFSKVIIDWIKTKKFEFALSIGGIATPNRFEIEHPAVYGIGSNMTARGLLKKWEIRVLEEGFLVGPYALILRECVKYDIPNILLLAQAYYEYPDPGAAASVLKVLNRVLNLNVEIESLLKQAEEIRLKMRELMRRTRSMLQRMQKVQEQELPPMYA